MHSTVNSLESDNASTANMRSRSDSNTSTLAELCVVCMPYVVNSSNEVAQVTVSLQVCDIHCGAVLVRGGYISLSLYSECVIGFMIYICA